MYDEQWRFIAKRTSADDALQKMMIFEFGIFMKITIAMFEGDQLSYFDRIWPIVTNVTARVDRAKTKELQTRAKLLMKQTGASKQRWVISKII